MGNNSGFTVIIPAYNESLSIAKTISELEKLPAEFEIIVVDDGSTDETFELAMKTKVKVLKHLTNRGYGASLKTGIRNARYNKIVIIDADGTYPNEKIPELVEILESENFDMVVGARTNKDVKIPLIRRPAKWFINRLASFLTKTKIPDLNSGLRVMKKSVLEKYICFLPDGFSFTTTITIAMLTNEYNVKYVPIDYLKRSGKSKIRPIHDTLDFIQLVIRTVLYFSPLRIFLPLSLPLIIIGFFLMLFQAIFYRNISTVSVIISLGGVQLLAVGMLADLIDKRTL
ncbi:MAG: glycosyltransferase family 2 protein [Candidatus Auribacterota bacterium]|nr:glycosyltransferase family 2 protein [Candidatus Auribacterota bacterium]